MRITTLLTFTALLLSSSLLGQSALQSPEKFLPTDYGNHFTPHHLLVDYFEHVAANSSQVILKEYGRTNEKRPLIWAVISSPDNLKNLETIRTDNLKRAGLMEGTPSDYKPVAIVWLSYGVHGNEAGGSESSLATVYELTRPNNKKVQDLLENAVVIMDPSINPDGYSRYTHWNWNAANVIPTPNPESREHNLHQQHNLTTNSSQIGKENFNMILEKIMQVILTPKAGFILLKRFLIYFIQAMVTPTLFSMVQSE